MSIFSRFMSFAGYPTTPEQVHAEAVASATPKPVIEKYSATWAFIEAHSMRRLEELRNLNDRDLNERDTAKLRGQIAAYKELLALVDPAQVSEMSPDPYDS